MAVDGQHQHTISLEYYSWMASKLKGAEERGTTDRLTVVDGTTVRDLLGRLADESPTFAELVYDRADDRLNARTPGGPERSGPPGVGMRADALRPACVGAPPERAAGPAPPDQVGDAGELSADRARMGL